MKKRRGRRHEAGTEQQAPHEISRPSPEVPFLQQAAVSNQEVHVEQEVEVERAEVEKIGDDAPHFSLADQWPAVEQSDRRDRVQLAEGRGEESCREIHPSDDGDVIVPR